MDKRIFHDVTQNEDEWYSLRLGKITASNFPTIMANNGKAFGEPAKKYAMRIALEDVTKEKLETYSNGFMDRGHEFEPIARDKYIAENMFPVNNGGFMEFGRFGASSDGLVGDKGMVEIKTRVYNIQFEHLIKGGYDLSYKYQIQGQIWIYDREWTDYLSYCDEMPEHKRLYTFRVDRDDEAIKSLKVRLAEFVALVDEYKEKLA